MKKIYPNATAGLDGLLSDGLLIVECAECVPENDLRDGTEATIV